MNTLVCVGLRHRTAPVELREKLAFNVDEQLAALSQLREQHGLNEALVLSTCNRVEVWAAGDGDRAPGVLGAFLEEFHHLPPGTLDDHLQRFAGPEAVTHLFRVASSLDALVVGEPQILGQVKDAFFRAAGAGATGPVLNRAFHKAFTVAKRVRTDTRIAQAAVSISYAGVELARKIFGELSGIATLLVGAGDMGELAARHFVEKGAELVVANRNFERARKLAADLGATAREFAELEKLIVDADVALVSTGAPGYIVTPDMVKRAQKIRRYRPLFLIDIAVPRNVDPSCAKLDGVYVYDVDDLAKVIEGNLSERKGEADRAEALVKEEVQRFERGTRELQAVPLIKALRQRFEAIALAEAQKTLVVLGDAASERQKKSVQSMAQAIVSKLLHEPTALLRAEGSKGADLNAELFAAVRDLFQLELTDVDHKSVDEVMVEAQRAEDALDLGDVPADAKEAAFDAARRATGTG